MLACNEPTPINYTCETRAYTRAHARIHEHRKYTHTHTSSFLKISNSRRWQRRRSCPMLMMTRTLSPSIIFAIAVTSCQPPNVMTSSACHRGVSAHCPSSTHPCWPLRQELITGVRTRFSKHCREINYSGTSIIRFGTKTICNRHQNCTVTSI